MKKFHVTSFGLALGLTWALGILLISILAYFDWGTDFVAALGKLYLGYSLSFGGVIIGLIWGFVDAFIGGAVFATLYNVFLPKK